MGHTPSDDHEERRLDPTCDACVDLLDASSVECRSNGDHGEASLGRHLGHEYEVSADQLSQTKEAKGYSCQPKGELCKRLCRKLDRLLDEIKSQQFSSEDPPAPALGGKAERCADEPAADGGGQWLFSSSRTRAKTCTAADRRARRFGMGCTLRSGSFAEPLAPVSGGAAEHSRATGWGNTSDAHQAAIRAWAHT